jgi:hypothetical protein
MYAEAAVDGSEATIWAPDATAGGGNLTVDLGSQMTIAGVAVDWTDARPASSSIQVSLDGNNWTSAPPADATGHLSNPVDARYVRVNMTVASGAPRTGIGEVSVTKA